MSSAAADHAVADDVGLSLIELIVVVVVVGILSSVVVMILVNSWTTQQDVNSTTVATNEGQVYASSIEKAVRNADAIQLNGAQTQLLVRTTLGGALTCQAFKIEPVDALNPARGDAAYLATGASATTWSGPSIRESVDPVAASYFTKSGKVITYAFQIETEASPVTFDGEVSARNNLSETGAPCW
ncbi:prepilin-type N-terminal cleavage/methylation domain-containing protein [Microbacterium hydrocarbonoxydans]|uniref:prepilin-type N-terminal cleavage/methylation domain-containing protein n=1 Tax=Microbacterium hydrocarbonoxydans TaxID=273678 RepID=UPI0007BBD4CE|nr:prepilin-type N-terminal cleavage/methylation domain-containing protein [Microbacterium hydrocarbonoxydans]GAT71640.1 prepilin-type N-terminal cleavage/methylation domain-containing protein [Microbacterium sp. HM58-2]